MAKKEPKTNAMRMLEKTLGEQKSNKFDWHLEGRCNIFNQVCAFTAQTVRR